MSLKKRKSLKKPSKYYYVFRSAITGRWINASDAVKFPKNAIRIRRLRYKGASHA